MSKIAKFVALVSAALAFPTAVAAQTVTFSEEPLGALPKEFDHGLMGVGAAGRWEVVRDETAAGGKALAQLSTDTREHRFLTAFYKPVIAANVEVTAHFKPVAGKTDQAGGVVVRLVGPQSYYVARANALEDNVRFYRIVKGRREQLATANVKVASGEWHSLGLKAENDRFTVVFNGKTLHSTSDRALPGPGRVALWTKSDSVTRFDQISIQILP